MNVEAVASNIQAYRNGFREVVKRSFHEQGFWHQMESQREEALRRWRDQNEVAIESLKEKILVEIERSSLQDLQIDLQTQGDQVVPLLKTSAVINKVVSARPTQLIVEMLEGQSFLPEIKRILMGCLRLSDEDFHFRSDWRGGKPYIFGNDLPVFKSLTSLAHEIGHLLVETNRHCPVSPSRHSLVGEAYAHALEYLIGHWYLNGRTEQQTEWRRWCDQVDYLNFYFFFLEAGETGGPFKEIPFYQPSLALRQAYYCTPGFQYINAFASLMRRKKVY